MFLQDRHTKSHKMPYEMLKSDRTHNNNDMESYSMWTQSFRSIFFSGLNLKKKIQQKGACVCPFDGKTFTQNWTQILITNPYMVISSFF